jgi:hypothetical protein
MITRCSDQARDEIEIRVLFVLGAQCDLRPPAVLINDRVAPETQFRCYAALTDRRSGEHVAEREILPRGP